MFAYFIQRRRRIRYFVTATALACSIPHGTVSVRLIPLPRTISPRVEQRTHYHVSGISKGISSAIERTSVPIFS